MTHDPAAPQKDAPASEHDAPEGPAPENPAEGSASSKTPDNPGTEATDPPPAGEGGILKTQRQRIIVYTLGAALAGLLAAWFIAVLLPNYLLYATPLEKADAVVLFGGGDFQARRKMADELVAKGWVKFVIRPAEGEIMEARVSKAPVTPEKTARMARAVQMDHNRRFVEQTHIEVLQALDLMKHIAAKRAIFVSSPYHMRRIAIMVDHVFPPEEYAITYLPTAYDPPHWPWFAHWQDVKWVLAEGVKIVWYVLYSPFV